MSYINFNITKIVSLCAHSPMHVHSLCLCVYMHHECQLVLFWRAHLRSGVTGAASGVDQPRTEEDQFPVFVSIKLDLWLSLQQNQFRGDSLCNNKPKGFVTGASHHHLLHPFSLWECDNDGNNCNSTPNSLKE